MLSAGQAPGPPGANIPRVAQSFPQSISPTSPGLGAQDSRCTGTAPSSHSPAPAAAAWRSGQPGFCASRAASRGSRRGRGEGVKEQKNAVGFGNPLHPGLRRAAARIWGALRTEEAAPLLTLLARILLRAPRPHPRPEEEERGTRWPRKDRGPQRGAAQRRLRVAPPGRGCQGAGPLRARAAASDAGTCARPRCGRHADRGPGLECGDSTPRIPSPTRWRPLPEGALSARPESGVWVSPDPVPGAQNPHLGCRQAHSTMRPRRAIAPLSVATLPLCAHLPPAPLGQLTCSGAPGSPGSWCRCRCEGLRALADTGSAG